MDANRNNSNFPVLDIKEYFQFSSPEKSKNGLVAIGGNLSLGMLFSAYMQGIFPWFNEDEPILWWSPDPRFVLFPEELHIPKSLRRVLNQKIFTFSMDKAFEDVILSCATAKRQGQSGTWINSEMIESYCNLHQAGYAHSVEAYLDGKLVGGFYGVLIGSVFFGESMFSHVENASKAAFCTFVEAFRKASGKLIDSQIYTDHIARFGGRNISRAAFLRYEKDYLKESLLGEVNL